MLQRYKVWQIYAVRYQLFLRFRVSPLSIVVFIGNCCLCTSVSWSFMLYSDIAYDAAQAGLDMGEKLSPCHIMNNMGLLTPSVLLLCCTFQIDLFSATLLSSSWWINPCHAPDPVLSPLDLSQRSTKVCCSLAVSQLRFQALYVYIIIHIMPRVGPIPPVFRKTQNYKYN